MSDDGMALATRIRAELVDLERLTQRVEHLWSKAAQDEDVTIFCSFLDGLGSGS